MLVICAPNILIFLLVDNLCTSTSKCGAGTITDQDQSHISKPKVDLPEEGFPNSYRMCVLGLVKRLPIISAWSVTTPLSTFGSCGYARTEYSSQFNTLSAVLQGSTDAQVRNCDHVVRRFQNLPKTSANKLCWVQYMPMCRTFNVGRLHVNLRKETWNRYKVQPTLILWYRNSEIANTKSGARHESVSIIHLPSLQPTSISFAWWYAPLLLGLPSARFWSYFPIKMLKEFLVSSVLMTWL
jgi:hypothetical protein